MVNMLQATCSGCGFKQKGIVIGKGKFMVPRSLLGCSFCKKVFDTALEIDKCPTCRTKLIAYPQNPEGQLFQCPNCGIQKLTFSKYDLLG